MLLEIQSIATEKEKEMISSHWYKIVPRWDLDCWLM